MQKVMMELKLLNVAARRATGAGGAARAETHVDTGAARAAEAEPLESWLTSRLQLHEKAVSEMQRSTTEAVGSLKLQISALCSELATARRRGDRREAGTR